MKKTLPIYLDYASSTPIDPRVKDAMMPFLGESQFFGNPSSSHFFGQQARAAVEKAREQVASLLQIKDPSGILFTSGATESNNLAIKGIAQHYALRGKHLISSKTEHKSVLDVMRFLESQGFEVSYLPVDSKGHFNLEDLIAAIRPDTILISLMWGNNETGTLHPIEKIALLAQKHGVFFHSDLVQGLGKIPLNLSETAMDLASLSAHKIYGPKGIGALYLRPESNLKLTPQIHGGGQEKSYRAGTLPTHQIVGLGAACALAEQELTETSSSLKCSKAALWAGLSDIPEAFVNGDPKEGLPHILNVCFPGTDSESLMAALPQLAVSAGSACNSATIEVSHVLRAMGLSMTEANSSLRFSLGKYLTGADIEQTIALVKAQVARLRALSPFWTKS